VVTLDQLGGMIDDYVRGLESGAGARAELGQLRDEAICRVTDTIAAAPALPEVASCR
jgi:hypothetical protein